VTRNLKRFIARFQAEDRRADDRRKLLVRLHRRRELDAFRALVAGLEDAWKAGAAERAARGIDESDDRVSEATVVVEEEYEVVVEERVEDV